MIQILRPDLLADQLAHDRLSSTDKFIYLITYMILQNLVYRYGVWTGVQPDPIWYVEAALEIFILMLGIFYCWRINGGASGQDLITRVICLAIPAGIITNIVGFSGGFVLRAISQPLYHLLPFHPYVTYYGVNFSFFVALNVLFWAIIGLGIRRIVRQLA